MARGAGAPGLSHGELDFTGDVRTKIAVLIVRLLLGLVFLGFGLNAFLQFLKGPVPGGLAGQYLRALFLSHYVLGSGAVQAVGGALFVAVLWFVLFFHYRQYFSGIFTLRASSAS